ncbi:uncharacterized protein PAF06_020076 [Gastrophryne carolinensis]
MDMNLIQYLDVLLDICLAPKHGYMELLKIALHQYSMCMIPKRKYGKPEYDQEVSGDDLRSDICHFYQDLFTDHSRALDADMQEYCQVLEDRLTVEDAESLEGEVTKEEVWSALSQMAKGKNASSRFKEEDDMDSSYTDNSGLDLSTHSDVYDHVKMEDCSNSYGSMKEERELKMQQGDLVYNTDTPLCIRPIDDADLTTDDDSEAKDLLVNSSTVKGGRLKTVSASGIADKVVRRHPRFTASEEFVLVTEMLEHYERLFGERARITPFTQKALIWQKVLDNVNAVSVVQRGIEEAKKHWHLYRQKLMEKLASLRKRGSDPGQPLFFQLTPLESKVANLFQTEYTLRSPQYVAGDQAVIEPNQNGGGAGDQGVASLGHGDYLHSKAPRNMKFSFDENCALVHEAAGVWDSIIGRNAAAISQVRKNQLWSKIVEAVNAAGTQPRSIENCKKRLRDIKRRVKAKMADQRKYCQRNGGGGGPGLELQYLSYEEELMHVLGPDTIRPVDGHVDTDREPGKSEPEETCEDEDFWTHSSFDMAEEDEDDDKETIVKMEPIDYSTDANPSPEQQLPVVAQPVSTQPYVLSPNLSSCTKPLGTSPMPTFLPTKCPTVGPKPLPFSPKPLFISNKPLSFSSKPPLAAPQPPSYPGAIPGCQPTPPNTEAINKAVGTFHSAQHNYHRSQRHQMHVMHMDLLHLGTGLQRLTKNVKVNNHVRATARSRELRLKQKELEDQRQYRQEKLHLLRQHHQAKQKLLQQHFDRKERLMEENNQMLQNILQQLCSPTGPASASKAASEDLARCLASSPPACDGPSVPQNSVRTFTHKRSRVLILFRAFKNEYIGSSLNTR